MSETRRELLAAVERAVGKDSPDFAAFSSLLDRGEASGLDPLLGEVDDTDYSLADWVAAFVAFDEWLAEKGEKRRPLAEMRGYIHCLYLHDCPAA